MEITDSTGTRIRLTGNAVARFHERVYPALPRGEAEAALRALAGTSRIRRKSPPWLLWERGAAVAYIRLRTPVPVGQPRYDGLMLVDDVPFALPLVLSRGRFVATTCIRAPGQRGTSKRALPEIYFTELGAPSLWPGTVADALAEL